jgi:hypothetical protein
MFYFSSFSVGRAALRPTAAKEALHLNIKDCLRLPTHIRRLLPPSDAVQMKSPRRFLPLLAVLAMSAARGAEAILPAAVDAAWRSECSACHLAYPPGLLAAADWRRLMADLDHHFGANAGVDAALRERIDAFLADHAAPDDGEHSATSLRITETEWFVARHRRKAARLWLSGRVASPAECSACHRSPDDNYW